MRAVLALAVSALAAGCTWVTPSPEALQSNIQVLDAGAVAHCNRLAANELKVAYELGTLQRMPEDVEHDLSTMAMNQAATVGADAVAPLNALKDGTQIWGLFRCGAMALAPAAATTTAPPESTGLKTLPYTPPR